MKCWKCGNEIQDNSQICVVCGERIDSSLESQLLKGPVPTSQQVPVPNQVPQQAPTQVPVPNQVPQQAPTQVPVPNQLPATEQVPQPQPIPAIPNNNLNPTAISAPGVSINQNVNANQGINGLTSVNNSSVLKNNIPPAINKTESVNTYTETYESSPKKGDGKAFGIFLIIIIAIFATHFFLTNGSSSEEKKEDNNTVVKNKNENETKCKKTDENIIIKYENDEVKRISFEQKIEKSFEELIKKMYYDLNQEYGGIIYYIDEEKNILDVTLDFEVLNIKKYLKNEESDKIKIEIIDYSYENDIIKKDKVLEFYKDNGFNCE